MEPGAAPREKVQQVNQPVRLAQRKKMWHSHLTLSRFGTLKGLKKDTFKNVIFSTLIPWFSKMSKKA
ncbi:hypothetical protein SAMN06296241_3111 [Salinimicrobium sediminis]|uniref:Uncharacterized protein n=1 Tax=Salinimicrobium sediminis TaxID=1343891 RepID=A0A285X9S6_9FLAO|nr:hypothetical protein SAMN06296241_3111 [Salinimicrobium sediminis]